MKVIVSLGVTMTSVVPNSLVNIMAEGLQETNEQGNLAAEKKDGIYANWKIDEATKKGGEICEVNDGWLHMASSAKNGNDAKNKNGYPAVFVNDHAFDFSQPGYFSTKLKTGSEASNTRFGFYLGYKDPGNGLFLGYDAGGWFWQKYKDGKGDYYGGTRVAAPQKDEEVTVKIEWTDDHKVSLIINNNEAFPAVDYSDMDLSSKIGFKAGSFNNEISDIYMQDMDYTGQDVVLYTYAISGKVVDEANQPIANASVTIGKEKQMTNDQGEFTFDDKFINGEYNVSVVKDGFAKETRTIQIQDGDYTFKAPIQLAKEVAAKTFHLETGDMSVELYENFPAVRKYTMTSESMKDKVMYGQTQKINTITINGVDVAVKDEDVTLEKGNVAATYTMKVKNTEEHIDAVVSAKIRVEANKLFFEITDIQNNLNEAEYPVQTIAIPNHSLVSMRSNQKGANFTGAVMSSNTQKTGDENFAITSDMKDIKDRDYMYAFISNDELSAGMWSNSEHEGRVVAAPVYGGSQNTRILATTSDGDTYKSLGLASAPWYYHRVVTDSKGNSYQVNETEMPKMAITITGDSNNDNKVNWQDGAIAFRDIMNNPYKSEEVPELVAWRIAMNFGGQAQNPFLTTLDNVKRVALHTDGLGQSVLLKGYGNEGHDSGHPDYGDIGKRIGGAKDMNTLMEKGKAYGARFGIHVNASEMYPEAKAFDENMVRRNKEGGLSYGWNWLDQGIGIDGIYDLASGSREKRFADLKSKVGDNMDFIYLDVWGNQTSGVEDSWETRKMSKMIIDNGWRMTTEWGSGNEYDSTFQHWAADLTYGDFEKKGENSQVMRFLRNHQKDSWVGDYPSYGGAANAPLLGGYNMKDFEGWQGRNDYDAYIKNLYTHDVSTKFIQHFKVSRWVNNPLDQTSVQDKDINNGNEQITLQDDKGNTLVLARKSNDQNSADYRYRTMTFNGKIISQGRVTPGDEKNLDSGNESYLLPWLWDAQSGEFVESSNEKLYHWNTKGGTTSWELPENWKSLSNVTVYKLTDQGKQEEKQIDVIDGKITLEAKAQTPYVVCKGEESQIDVKWSEGMHIVDAGFNGGLESLKENWKITGDGKATIAKSQHSNPMLKLSGEVSTTQTLTDLEPGKDYALYVGVDNRSAGKATATITANGKVLTSNYTEESIAKNYVKAYTHNTNSSTVDGSSYFQNMYVFFTAPKDGSKVQLTLSHDGEEGDTYFDDIRIVENTSKNIKVDENGKLVSFTNDFETNAQGIYPFVVGGSEGVEDNRIHLSEKHAPYTQAGWDVKKMDDVLDGDWSVKINGLSGKNSLIYQTIPQNVRFEPGVTYKISFDYQAGDDDTYAVAIGHGETGSSKMELQPLKKALGKTATYEFELTGALDGNSWFGIYSTSKSADTGMASSDAEKNFGGYKDLVLDNLSIEKVNENFTKEEAHAKLEEVEDKYQQKDFSPEAWQLYQTTLTQAKVLLDKEVVSEEDYAKAYMMLRALDNYMQSAPGNEISDVYDIDTKAYEVSVGSEQAVTGNEGPKDYASDNNPNTYWHTDWDEINLDNAWMQFDFKEPATVDGLRYMARPGGTGNGAIKDFKLIFTLADGSKSVVEKTGSFETKDGWQKFSFDAIKNVTSVRLKVESSGGPQPNQFASAAELRLTTPKDIAPEEVKVNKTKLEKEVAIVKDFNKALYTSDSYANVMDKLEKANAVLGNKDATQYDVDLALENLQDAVASLTLKAENKTPLHLAILDAKLIDTSIYSEDSVAALHKAIAAAQVVLDNEDATQAEVDEALKTLQDAMKNLSIKEEVSVDKHALLEKLNEAIAKDKNAYTADSWKVLANAMEHAQTIMESEDATQDEIDEAFTKLDDAIRQLMTVNEKPNNNGQNGSNGQNGTNGSNGQNGANGQNGTNGTSGNNTGNVETGDHTQAGMLFTLAVLSGGAIVVMVNRKRKAEKK